VIILRSSKCILYYLIKLICSKKANSLEDMKKGLSIINLMVEILESEPNTFLNDIMIPYFPLTDFVNDQISVN
jgi:hypothetical protein